MKYKILNKKKAPFNIKTYRSGNKIFFISTEQKIKIYFGGCDLERKEE